MGVELNIPYAFKTEPFKLMEKEIDHISIRDFSYEPDYVKGNKTVLQVLVDQDSLDYDNWLELRKDMKKYREFKNEFASFIQDKIENHIPELKGKLSLLDVATPITLNRYSNA